MCNTGDNLLHVLCSVFSWLDGGFRNRHDGTYWWVPDTRETSAIDCGRLGDLVVSTWSTLCNSGNTIYATWPFLSFWVDGMLWNSDDGAHGRVSLSAQKKSTNQHSPQHCSLFGWATLCDTGDDSSSLILSEKRDNISLHERIFVLRCISPQPCK